MYAIKSKSKTPVAANIHILLLVLARAIYNVMSWLSTGRVGSDQI